ncbi:MULTISPECIES: DUF445 family protein [Vibrio]|uniref:DUF445 family protein n=1 Tax=Vibrio algicola TaxID=2662262 RepID=A0A5Q0TJV3_9VIBR|nr:MULTISPECIES: DUF445 family protein [Vibrio]MBD1577685.1 DUF445 family protein [Vibrio sp. S11_S32]
MNKSLITNLLSLALLAIGYFTQQTLVLYAGLFAFSGAITNWLAIHMLFEKVPGLYGSGVIPARFEQFKSAIKHLMMDEFFTGQNIENFISNGMSQGKGLDLQPVIEKIDLAPSFDSLTEVILNSSFGGMLAMMGGAEALQPLKQPFIDKMQQSMVEISHSEQVQQAVQDQLHSQSTLNDISTKIESIIDQRLDELTPKMVKEMVQTMIKQHLGWLVVWGGIFGGLIGIISALITAL